MLGVLQLAMSAARQARTADRENPIVNLAQHSSLAAFVRLDGKWLRCAACGDAYWGAFRDTAWVKAKLAAHRAKAHGDAAPKAARPQRRKAAAKVAAAPAPPKALAPASDPLAGLGAMLDPRLDLSQGPRFFEQSGGDKARQVTRRARERFARAQARP